MPAALTYPGVYVEELESGVHTISGVATSIAAFVGRTLRGPVNDPVSINSWADFERQFGGLWLDSPLSFAVQDFFLNGGGQAIIIRLFHPPYATDDARAAALAAAQTKAQAGADAVSKAASDAVAGAADAKAVADAAATAANGLADKVQKEAGTIVAAAAATAAKAKPADQQGAADAAKAAVAGAVSKTAEQEAPLTRAAIDAGGLHLEAAAEGSWGNNLQVIIDQDVSVDPNAPKDPAAFNLTVRDAASGDIEVFRNLSVTKGDPRQADLVLKASSNLVHVAGAALPGAAPNANTPPKPGKGPWDDPSYYYAVGGPASDGSALTKADFLPDKAPKQGLYALDKADIFNLLCIPPHSLQGTSDVTNGDIEQDLIDAAISYCEQRRAIFLIDPPFAWTTKQAALDGIAGGVGSPAKNAAIYFPAILRPNRFRSDREEPFAPCGAVAGVIARTDTERGVWKAPAGLGGTLLNAPKLAVSLTDAENGELNPKGINCLRMLPAAGRVVWGARTRRGDDRLTDQWKYLPVRRTALFIEESLYRGTQWVVFEPNDEPLWSSIRLNVGSFMHQLFRQGAFQGATPREAYLVKCDKETTTQADIDSGVVNILVGFAPLKPAEFVVLQIQQLAGQIQV